MARHMAERVRDSQRKQQEALIHAQQSVRHSKAARTEELSSQYLDYGKKARSYYMKHGLMSEKESKWADRLMSGGEKAPVTMLAQCGEGGPCNAVPKFNLKHGITSPAEAAWARKMNVESAADKARRTELADFGDFDTQAQGDDNYGAGVSNEVHRQNPGVDDHQGFPSTGMLRAPIQSLLLPKRFTPEAKAWGWPMLGRDDSAARAVPIPDAFGSLGTAAQPTDPVYQEQVATGVAQLKQLFSEPAQAGPGRRIGDDVSAFLFRPAHAAGF